MWMAMLSSFTLSKLYTNCANLSFALRLVRPYVDQLIPRQNQQKLLDKIRRYFFPKDPRFTLLIHESVGLARNQLYDAAEVFLRSRIDPSVNTLKVAKLPKEKDLVFTVDRDQEVVDVFQGIRVTWKLVTEEKEGKNPNQKEEIKFFELRFDKEHKEKIMKSYLPHVLKKSKSLEQQNKVLKLFSHKDRTWSSDRPWSSVRLEHPSTFDTLAMDQKLKREIIDDLKRFLKRKEFYKKVGKAWKRGYLLYGPPGTGKSSLIAAMANYLKFDIYDLELTNVQSNGELRRLLVTTANRSILVIEDIDCSVKMRSTKTSKEVEESTANRSELTLSGLLNFIDGLWSSCGDERIIIFTTNHRDQLDPALLRPGRMDRHIHLSYCTVEAFNILASNYLGIQKDDEKSELYLEIEETINNSMVTPAEVAEELMKSDEADVALGELLEFLKRKRAEQGEAKKDNDENIEIKDPIK